MSDLESVRVRVRDDAQQRDWTAFHTPKNLAMALSGEVGELVAELQWLSAEQSSTVMADPDAADRLRAEIADVTVYLVRLADVLGVDLAEAAHTKLDEIDRRYRDGRYRYSESS